MEWEGLGVSRGWGGGGNFIQKGTGVPEAVNREVTSLLWTGRPRPRRQGDLGRWQHSPGKRVTSPGTGQACGERPRELGLIPGGI